MIRQLRQGGYEPIATRVDTPETLSAALEQDAWDLVIADYSMPRFSGVDALKLVQAKRLDVPFILVSGTIGEETAVEAMKAGAHDYLMKDNLKRLGAAIARELREAQVRRERKQAQETLKQKTEELTKLFENTVGREERVIDLKAEVNQLLQELGRTLKYLT